MAAMLTNALKRLRVIGPDDGEFRDVEEEVRRQAYLESRLPQPDCLDELEVAAFVDVALDDDERRRTISHLTGCARCRALVRATASLVADESVVEEISDARTGGRRWPRLVAATAAAAAIVTIAVLKTTSSADDLQLREPAIAATIAPATVEPRGSVGRVENLRWTSVPGAYRYRVRVLLADGSLIWSGETVDTLLRLPDSVQLRPGVRYSWVVDARTEWQRTVASDPTAFIIGTSRP